MSTTTKLTLKNIMVYDYMRTHNSGNVPTVKAIWRANQDEIAKLFNITTYVAFNFHVRKVIDWEGRTGNKVNVIKLNSEGL